LEWDVQHHEEIEHQMKNGKLVEEGLADYESGAFL
jgi:hypothetical protein